MNPELESLRGTKVGRIHHPAPKKAEPLQGQKLLQTAQVFRCLYNLKGNKEEFYGIFNQFSAMFSVGKSNNLQ